MKSPLPLLFALSLFACGGPAAALSQLSPDAPKDNPRQVHGDADRQHLFQALAPYVAEARKTWPEAKRRYLAGLPPHHVFFVTTKLVDMDGAFEIAFVEVRQIERGVITGEIANDIVSATDYHKGQTITVPETEIWDWTVSRPDGSEEGNVVGKFLETYRP